MDEEELKKKLSPEAFHVTQEQGTEAPFSGKHYKNDRQGKYSCVVCGAELFSSDTKIDPESYSHMPGLAGWPSFDQALPGAVEYNEDPSQGMSRTEVVCAKCGAHLGHVFDDPKEKTCRHFCVNSVALDFKEKK